VKRLLFFLLVLALGLAQAQVIRNFTSRYSTNTTGDIVIIGNTLMTCPTSTDCTNARNGSGSILNNNSFAMVYVDADSDPTTFNSSSATLNLPTGASVLWAGLYWGAEAPSLPSPNTVHFRTPATAGYQTLIASQTDSLTAAAGRIRYQGFVEVTALVQAGGNGTYWAANVTGSPNNADRYAGWSLVVVYQHPSQPLRHLNVFDGYASVTGTTTVNTPVSGFLTPATGPVNVRLGTVAYEGDLGTTGDRMQLNGTDLSNATNPATNFFNSTISDLGAHLTSKTPNYINQLGFDIDRLEVSGPIGNNQSSATVSFVTSGDAYYPGVLTFTVNIYAPNLTTTFTKTVNDLNGGNVLVGDVLEYTISFTNTGGDGATNVVVRDPIPAGTQYVPGSLQVLSNAAAAPTGTFTDASGDDIAEYATACPELSGSPPCVRFRLGTGANATQGGLILPSQGASVRFRVQVLPSAAGTTLTNTAQVSYNGQTLGTAFNQSASATASASVPTPPSLSKAFSPGSIPVGGTSTLTLTLTNPNASPATLTAALVDNLPSGLVVASPAGTATTCPSGTVTANPGSSTVSLGNGAQIPANGSCTVSVNVTGSAPGSYTNTLPAGALQTNQGNNTTAASATLSILGASLSGRVYADQEPNGMAEPSEGWSGPTVYVNLVQGGSVVQSVAVSAGSGAYTFSAVPPGSYTLVVATTPTATTPAAPTGWLFVNPAGSRSIAMSGSSLAGQDFGLFNGSRIRGTVFRDDGQGSGTANNALQDGGEPGIPNVLVTASSGTNSRSAYTDANGLYTLFIPASFGSSLTLSHPQQPATGSNVGGSSVSLAASYGAPAAASRTIGSFAAGQYYEGYNFGVARESRLSPDQSGQTTSPGTITYAHLFRPGTLGSVSLGATGGGFTYRLRRDANCDGDFDDPGEGFVAPPLGFSVDATWPREPDGSPRACAVELEVQVPGGVPHGSVDLVQLNLSLTWANNPSVVEAKRLVDTTTILPPGGLSLTKEVRNVTQGTPFARSGAGRPGEVLEYCIAYQNLGSQPITGVVLTDPIPFFTLYQAGSLRLGGTPLTEAADSDPGEVSGGVVRVQIGNLAAGAGGSVCYRVQVK